MDWDDESDEMIHGADSAGSVIDGVSERRLDPMDISDPASADFLVSDDVQGMNFSGKEKGVTKLT